MLFVSFPLLFLIFFFVFNFCQFYYYASRHSPPRVYPAYDSLDLLDCVTVFFPMLGKFSAIISSNIFSGLFFLSSPQGTPIMKTLTCLMLSQKYFRLSSFLFFFFFFFFFILFLSSDFHRSVFQVTYLFFCLLWIHSSVLFVSVCLFFRSSRSW